MAQTPPDTIRLPLPQALQRAVNFHQKGLLVDAAKIYTDILKIQPGHYDSLHMLGVVKFQQGQAAEALPLLEAALKIQPESPELLSNYGMVLRALQRPADALAAYDKALKAKRAYPEALANRGHLLTDLGRLDEALESFDRAIMARRGFVDALIGRGIALIRLKRQNDALVSFERVLTIDPRNLDALTLRAGPLYDLKRYDESIATSNKAIEVNPRLAVAYYNRGVALGALGRHAEAAASYDLAIALNPTYVDALFNRGNALEETNRLAEALASYDQVFALAPEHSRAWNNRGNVLLKLQRHEEAIECYKKAIAIDPQYGECYYNHGNALLELERIPEAFDYYTKAVALRPDHPDIPFNEGMTRLLLGDLREGLKRYEGRFDKREQAPLRRGFSQPFWNGGDLNGKRILLHSEQGLGDTIQFARYIPLVARKGGEVILEVQTELKTLLTNVEGVTQIVGRGERLPDFDVHHFLVSLAMVMGTELETIPAEVPYIYPAPDRVAKWQERMPRTGKLRVGLVWSGNPLVKTDAKRSIGLAKLAPLLDMTEVQFFSLHKQVRPADAPLLGNLPIVHFGEELQDFADTAAVISQLDLVIGSDTSVIHLAGAMAKPFWLLTKLSPDWRWLLQREDNPWYPTAKLYRQPKMDDWESVVERVRNDLALLAQGKVGA
jgi:tetratricopeptide (TPR) repeat protein